MRRGKIGHEQSFAKFVEWSVLDWARSICASSRSVR